MNYLGHFVYNHEVCGLAATPYFAMGVALPDLWPRFSRTRRIRWRAVRAAEPVEPADAALRAGLLNHVEADRRFHGLACFGRWQRTIRAPLTDDGLSPALLDFLAHVAVELALDHHLVCGDATRADRFYGLLGACDLAVVERSMSRLASVDATGLGQVLQGFLVRQFVRHYGHQAALVAVLRRVLDLVASDTVVPDALLIELLRGAIAHVDPYTVWSELAAAYQMPR